MLADRRRRRSAIAAAGLAAAAAALVVVPTSGQVPANLLVPSGSGITAPGGIVDTPSGIWVTDHLNGVCRVQTTDPKGLVPSDYCALVPQGPTQATGLAFDPATSNLYVGEGSSKGGGIWRMHIGPAGTIDAALKIADAPGDRVTGVGIAATGPAGALEVYYTTKRALGVSKLSAPETGGLHSPVNVGFAGEKAVPSLAALGTTLYLAESTGVTQIDLASATPPTAVPIPNLAVALPGGLPTALAVDASRNRLYAGTTNSNGIDQIDVVTPATGDVETYSTGLSGVSAVFLEPDGSLLVADDPTVSSGAQAEGQGRLWTIPVGALNPPVTTITAAPATFTSLTSATFEFSSRPGATFQCRFENETFAPCTTPVGRAGLGEGAHSFEVFASEAAVDGPVVRRTWVVDTTAPTVSVDNSASDHQVQGGDVTMLFSSNEANVAFLCSLDGAAPEPCDPPLRLRGLALGDHTFSVTGSDRAGNPSAAPASFDFTVVPRPSTSGSGPGAGSGSESGSAGGAAGGDPSPGSRPAAASVVEEPTGVRVTPVLVLRARTATLGRTRVRRRQLVARPLGLAFNAHDAARFVRVTIQPYWRGSAILARRRARTPRIVLKLVAPVEGGRRNYLRWRLTPRQVRRLTPGRYRVTVALGETRRTFGPQKVLTLRVLHHG